MDKSTVSFEGVEFVKSNWSLETNCVTVGRVPGFVGVRDSKDESGTTLVFTDSEWSAFLGGARDGQFGE